MVERPYLVVTLSTASHAYWNYLFKRAGGGEIFVALSKIAEVIIFAPVFALLARPDARALASMWPLVVVGALLVLANYSALSRAYAGGDLAVVYPVSRAGALLFLPALGYVVFGERVSVLGLGAMIVIVVGLILLQLPVIDRGAFAETLVRLRSRPVGFALAAAFVAALYTIWDKRAVTMLPAFTYFYAYTTIVAASYLLLVRARHSPARIREEWSRSRASIVLVGVLNTVTYLLVLDALRGGTSSYVIALRQLSIAWGVLLGWWLLDEPLGVSRWLGVATLLIGCALVALSA